MKNQPNSYDVEFTMALSGLMNNLPSAGLSDEYKKIRAEIAEFHADIHRKTWAMTFSNSSPGSPADQFLDKLAKGTLKKT
jgi:hypothetical protein